jgi:hypothetical protein
MSFIGKSFRADDLNQSLLFPPSLHDWLPEAHLARFLSDVVNALDLEGIYASYSEKDGRGMSAYAPAMMVRVLLYGYATGVYSSRKIQAKTSVRSLCCMACLAVAWSGSGPLSVSMVGSCFLRPVAICRSMPAPFSFVALASLQ